MINKRCDCQKVRVFLRAKRSLLFGGFKFDSFFSRVFFRKRTFGRAYCQRRTAIKSLVANRRHAVGNNNRFQRRTAPKSGYANRRHAVGKINRFQRITAPKSAVANSKNGKTVDLVRDVKVPNGRGDAKNDDPVFRQNVFNSIDRHHVAFSVTPQNEKTCKN